MIAITSFRRCSDIQALRLGEGNVNVQKNGLFFIREGLAKQDRPSHFGAKIFIPAFTENKLLDPKRALLHYLKQTESFRKSDSSRLFLAISKPHNPVTVHTISNWIVNTVKMAYDSNKSVKAHSTRALGPTWALFKGASMKSILESADWKRESIFINFYLRKLDNADVCVLAKN